MASTVLGGNDLILKGPFALSDDGTVYLDRYNGTDFDIGGVSKQLFSFNHNKSIVFTFKADPYTEKQRKPTVWFNDKNIAYIDNNKNWIVNGNNLGHINMPNGLKGSNSFVGVKDDVTLILKDLTNSDAKLITVEDVVNFDVSSIGYGYIKQDSGKNKVEVTAEDGSSITNIPDSVNNYSEDAEAPVKIAIGNKIAGIIRGSGEAVIWGDNAPSYNGVFKDIQIAGDDVYLLSFNGELLKNGEMIEKDVAFFSVGDDGSVAYVKENGTSNVATGYPVEVFKYADKFFSAMRNGTNITNVPELNNAIVYINKNSTPISTEYNTINTQDGIVVAFGIQREDLDNNVPRYVDKTGSITPIIHDAEHIKSNFKWVSENNKGFILTKHPLGKDVVFSMKGQQLEPMVVDGANVLPEQLVDFGKNAYKLVISFTPFGKAIRLFKLINGEYIEINSNFLSLQENPFPTGRIAFYIKNISSFELDSIEVTDELDTSLLPEEIIYRDIDTDILQTKVAESLNVHTETLNKVVDTLGKQANKVAEMSQALVSKIKDLETRISALEE